MITRPYKEQVAGSPASGRHILARHDAESVYVYQAYRPSIAVPSSFEASGLESHAEWRRAVEASDVRLQWDPDHDPFGRPLQRKAIQLGLRGRALARYGQEEILSIENVTSFVTEQAECLRNGLDDLMIPEENVYRASAPATRNIGAE